MDFDPSNVNPSSNSGRNFSGIDALQRAIVAKFQNFYHAKFVQLELRVLDSLAVNTSFALGICFVSVLSLRFIYYKWTHKARQPSPLGLDAAQALCSVFTPTMVAWPLSFAKLFSECRVKTDSSFIQCVINLDLCELLSRICDGQLELRDSRDLALLFQRRLNIYAWDLTITAKRRWLVKAAKWFAKQHFVESSPRITTQGVSTHWPLACILRIASSSRPSFDLDFVPYHDLQAEIRRIHELHRIGNVTIIEFSCLGPGVQLMSSDFLLCTVPFILNDPAKDMHIRTKRLNRTSMPFFVQMHDIVSILTTRKTITIKSVVNISSEHAQALHKLEQDLANDRDLRAQHINDVGLTCWRQDRLMIAWEAGLLSSKLLVRWRITFSDIYI